MEKCYSVNDEEYRHTDIESVLDDLESNGNLKVGASYFEADCAPVATDRLLSADQILEAADEQGYELIGETWDNPFDVSGEARQELQALLNTWAAKHVKVGRYFEIVGLTRKMTVTLADVDSVEKSNDAA